MFKKLKKADIEVFPISVIETKYTDKRVELSLSNSCDFCGSNNCEGFDAISGLKVSGLVINGIKMSYNPFICKSCVKSLSTYCNK